MPTGRGAHRPTVPDGLSRVDEIPEIADALEHRALALAPAARLLLAAVPKDCLHLDGRYRSSRIMKIARLMPCDVKHSLQGALTTSKSKYER